MVDTDWPFFDLTHEEKNACKSLKDVSLNMWGSCTPKTFMKTIRRTACLKPLHVALLREVLSICEHAGLRVFAYAGTALGLYREGGKMLSHDYDSDLAILEYAEDETGNLSKLANFCLSSNVEVSGIEGLDGASVLLRKADEIPKIAVSFRNALSSEKWLYMEKADSCTIGERSYTGEGAKTAKFTFTEHGLRSFAKQLPRIKPSQLCELVNDPSNIHVDLFTLSPHPSSPVQHLRVNWHFGDGYNACAKLFSRDAFFPLKRMIYEDLPILAPANLETYLTVEYGYLGRDAMYDRESQRYIKISEAVFQKFPLQMQKFLSGPNAEQA
ncbi:unnamed protein product [Schistocephalus solidus]|uniref:LicD family protein n=1 Tax=Schistocephalus solidus TaxID=70667 RepID=A0A183TQJ3_SCHSO|nr:unnamed protein product [Schistocephalus solidus]